MSVCDRFSSSSLAYDWCRCLSCLVVKANIVDPSVDHPLQGLFDVCISYLRFLSTRCI
jgi:hypothetical protein